MKFNTTECTTCIIIQHQKKIIEQQQRIIDALTKQNRRLLLREKPQWTPQINPN